MADAGKMEVKPVEGESHMAPVEGGEADESTTLTAYGKETKLQAAVSGDEAERLVELAQKGLAADQRWRESQEATAKAKEDTDRAAAGIAVLDAAARLQADPNDMEAFNMVADVFGYTEEAKAAIIAQAAEGAGAGKGTSKTAQPPKPATEEDKWNALPKDVKAQLKQGFRDRRDADLKVAVAKDAVLGENNNSESRSAAILSMAVDEATRLMVVGVPDPVTGRNRTLAYGPEVVRKAVENVRQRIEFLGTHQEVSNQLPAPGAGRAPTGVNSRHAATKPKRVPMTDPNYGSYFQDLLQYHALQGDK